MLYINAYLWKSGTAEPICNEGMEMQMYRMDLWTEGRRGWDEWRVALTTIVCKIPCKMATGNLLNNTGSSAWYSVMTELRCMAETNKPSVMQFSST